MTNGSCHSTCESNVQTWLYPAASARRATSMTCWAGGSFCSTRPISMVPLPQVLTGSAGQVLAAPGRTVPFPVLDQDVPPRQHRLNLALHLAPLIGRVVHRHVVGGGGQHVLGR